MIIPTHLFHSAWAEINFSPQKKASDFYYYLVLDSIQLFNFYMWVNPLQLWIC